MTGQDDLGGQDHDLDLEVEGEVREGRIRLKSGRTGTTEQRLVNRLEKAFDVFFRVGLEGGIEWRTVFEGEPILIRAKLTEAVAEIDRVKFLTDGVSIVGPPEPFDAIACAAVLRRAWEEISRKPPATRQPPAPHARPRRPSQP